VHRLARFLAQNDTLSCCQELSGTQRLTKCNNIKHYCCNYLSKATDIRMPGSAWEAVMLETASHDRQATAQRAANNRSRITNRPQRMAISGRSALGRRVADLAEGFASQLGGWSALSPIMAANVRKAAELTALAERLRQEALRNGNVDPAAVVKIEGASNRAVRSLGLSSPAKTRPRIPSLSELRAREAAAKGQAK
jgi:hypothetical protein